MRRHKALFAQRGLRRTVDAVLLVHQYGHPHVLLLQIGETYCKLPGGRCRPGESEIDCLRRKLGARLDPPTGTSRQPPVWQIGELVARWFRPNFTNIMYPYMPPHVTQCKEEKRIFLCPLPERCDFAVPRNFRFIAVPLFHLYDNSKRYGSFISKLPECLSRLHFNLIPSLPPSVGMLTSEPKNDVDEREQ
jgi:cleavage and polyadenylation specificity factor subunit 5